MIAIFLPIFENKMQNNSRHQIMPSFFSFNVFIHFLLQNNQEKINITISNGNKPAKALEQPKSFADAVKNNKLWKQKGTLNSKLPNFSKGASKEESKGWSTGGFTKVGDQETTTSKKSQSPEKREREFESEDKTLGEPKPKQMKQTPSSNR